MIDGKFEREEIYYKQLMLYYEIYNLKSRKSVLNETPWHWHDEFEICLVKNGTVRYKTAMKEYVLQKGDVVFINCKTIHAVQPISPCDDMFMSVHFYNDIFISGGKGNFIDVNYVVPIQNNENVDMLVFKSGDLRTEQARKLIEENIVLKREKGKFWEFDLRRNICELWKIVVETVEEETVETVETDIKLSYSSNNRLRKAISFIMENYKEKITLNDIAANVNISTRECDRMFKKYLKISPIMYLHAIRLQKATSMLSDFDKTINEIAIENGYASSSHFGKVFKSQNYITPKEYRNRLKNGKPPVL